MPYIKIDGLPYFRGIYLPTYISHNQGMEGTMALATVYFLCYTGRKQALTLKKAEKEAGPITGLPTTLPGKIVSPALTTALLSPSVMYLAGVLTNSFYVPSWLENASFPMSLDLAVGVGGKSALRTIAALAHVALAHIGIGSSMRALGAHFHYIGAREKGRVVSTGPYAYVRHPLYSTFLAQLACQAFMFWSWLPVAGLGVAVGSLAYKIPLEESLMEDNLATGWEYVEYKQRVPYRLIPYVW
ncbi:hypothetical protein BD626DRAFT_163700 [Schizophyllum amplum]|uniref:Protein-S-isoprenylcysteine O-methyltransferase n=1 Tax=Schizophyllum amplum TaxID=97359 RepID=A0A550CPM3_9AGAR|nr:hypothetical protein BD626DRAFT_163700 [Auriculariopsis ampla]